MKKSNLLCLVLMMLCLVGLAGCHKEIKDSETVTANTTVHTLEDTREDAFEVHAANGQLVETYSSLYNAIYACVNDGDINDYVTKVNDTNPVFVNYERYADTSTDMYWYYDETGSLIDYRPWESGYWTITKEYGNAIGVLNSGAAGEVAYYGNTHQLVKLNDLLDDYELEAYPGNCQVWNSCWLLEASSTVDMAPYSGITKEVYEIKLSEAEISPSLDADTKAWAYVGFNTADGAGISQMGLRCDSTTGNWYYYNGEVNYNVNDLNLDEEKCLLTSTWDETNKCFRPNGDVTLTCELLTLVNEENDEYIVHRLTMEFSDGRKVVRDLESDILTQCGTIRFTNGLDLESDKELQDYMCGAKFKNLVVTKAEATILEEMTDMENYGNFAAFPAGTYDILNSNPATIARFHTILYTPTCITTDFNTPGRDVYGYEFKWQTSENTYGGTLKKAIDAINAIPANVTLDAEDLVVAAREAYDKLLKTQKVFVTNYDKLEAAEETLAIVAHAPLKYTVQNGNDIANDQIEYDPATGLYTLKVKLQLWGRIKFSLDDEFLTTENTNMTGYINLGGEADWTNNLYFESTDPALLLTCTGNTYVFTFNPETNTLDIQVEEVELAENEVLVKEKNADAELTVWTEAGTKLHDGATNTWLGKGWRLFLVCDSDGKILYGVVYPPNGYGGPAGDGYFVSEDYSDYTKNPAFNLLDGFGPWVEGGTAHNLFDVVVPEGGFAVTCHGESTRKMITLLSEGKITYGESTDDVQGIINSRTAFSQDMRISYDAEKGVVRVTKAS